MWLINKNYLIAQWVDVRAGLSMIAGLSLMLSLLLSGGCGIAIEEPDVGSPSVVDVFPRENSVDVRVDSEIRVTFSEAMAIGSINSASFVVSGDQNVPGTFNVAGNIVTFILSGALSPEKTYTVIINTTVADLVGNQMKEEFEWQFSTGVKLDRLSPVVHRTVPASGATAVSRNTAISATFTKTLDIQSFAEVQLRKGASTESLKGSVVYVDQTLVFYPSLPLEPSTKYVLEVEGINLDNRSIRDLAGNTPNSMSWSFTTGTEFDTSPPLPAAGQQQMPTSSIVPNDSVYAVFNEALDVATLNENNFYLKSTNQKIKGKVKYFDKQIIFIPTAPLSEGSYEIIAKTSIKDLAGNSLSEEYRQAVSVTNQNDIEFDVTDFVLIPTHDSSIVSASSSISVTFNKETLRPDSVHAQAITVTENDSLQPVAGEVSLINGRGLKFAPVSVLKNNQAYSVNVSGVMDLAGNSLLDPIAWSFKTVNVPDTTPPAIAARSPGIDASDVSTKLVSIAFNEELNSARIDEEALVLETIDEIPVSGAVTYINNRTVVFTPSVSLAPQTTYVATVNAASIVDLSGNTLSGNIRWQFTTALEADMTPPTVLLNHSSPPAQQNIDVIGLTIAVQFSEVINESSILQAGALQVSIVDGSAVAGTVSVEGSKATFTPAARFNYNESYQVAINDKVADLAGNILGTPVRWVFSTKNDDDAPTVKAHLPLSDTSNVKVSDLIINANFSEIMAADSITDQSFYLSNAGELVAASVSYEGTTAVLQPAADLDYATEYQVILTTGISDRVGNFLVENVQWKFTTEPPADGEPPVVQSTNPIADVNDVAIGIRSIDIQLSEVIDSASVTVERFMVKAVGGDVIQGQVSVSGDTVSFQLSSDLLFNTNYQVTLSGDIADLAGNVLGEAYVFSFTTSVAQDVTPPTVDVMLPNDGATDVVVNGPVISAKFSEEMASASITQDSFTVRTPAGEKIVGEVIYANRKARFKSSQPLIFNTSYTVELNTQVTDLAGNPLYELVAWSFTVQANLDKIRPNPAEFTPFINDKEVAVASNITVIFTEAMAFDSINNESFIVTHGSAEKVTGVISYQDNTAIFDPVSDLPADSRITVRLTSEITDEAGNKLANSPFTWSFDTKDTIQPTINESLLPANEQQNVTVTGPMIRVEVSEPMDKTTINTQTFTLTSPQGAVAGTVTYNHPFATFSVMDALAYDTRYTASVTRGVKDLAQNSLAQDVVWSFTSKLSDPNAAEEIIVPYNGVLTAGLTSFKRYTINNLAAGEHIVSLSKLDNDVNLQIYNQDFTESECFSELAGRLADFCVVSASNQKLYLEVQNANDSADSVFTINAPPLASISAALPKDNDTVEAGSIRFYQVANELSQNVIIRQWDRQGNANLYVYSDLNDEALCRAQNGAPDPNYCSISTAGLGDVFVVIDGSNVSAKTVYSLSLENWQVISVSSTSDTIEAGADFYVLDKLVAGVNYKIELSNMIGLSGNIAIELNADINAINGKSCSSGNNVTPPSCQAVANGAGKLYLVVDGFQSLAGTDFDLTITPTE